MNHLLSLFLILFPLSAQAESMTALWLSMPTHLLPYTDTKQRHSLADMQGMGIKAQVANQLKGETALDTITANYLRARLSGSTVLEMKRLATTAADSVVCVVKTWLAPMADSELRFYNQQWQPVEMNLGGRHGSVFQLSQWADGSSEEAPGASTHVSDEAGMLASKTEMLLVSARLSADADAITIVRQAPLVATDDREAVEALLVPTELKWTGTGFQ